MMHDRELVPVPQGLRGLEEALAGTWYPIEVEAPGGNGRFRSAIGVQDLDWLRVMRAYSNGPYRTHRKSYQAGDRQDHFILQLTEKGSIILDQYGRKTVSGPNTLVLMDASANLSTEQMGEAAVLAVTLPSRLLKTYLHGGESYCIRAVSASSGSAAILRELMLGIWRERNLLTGNDARSLPMALIRLTEAVFKNVSERDQIHHSAATHHLSRIKRVIEKEMEDPDLTPELVSRKLGISKSYLYSVTSEAGTSFVKLLIEHRLERAREMLADPAMIERSITDIALSTGFRELSHFSRRFHERFGASPKAYRKAVFAEASAAQH